MTTCIRMAVHLTVACNPFDGVLVCAVLFPNEMSLMRFETELSQFLLLFQVSGLLPKSMNFSCIFRRKQ